MPRRRGTVVHGKPRKRTIIKGIRSTSGPYVQYKRYRMDPRTRLPIMGRKVTGKVRGRRKR